jgi:hypothetical protein
MEMKKSFLMVLAAAALVGCAKSEGDPVIGESAEITLRSDIVDASGVVSRAPFAGTIGLDNVLAVRVVSSVANNFASSARANGVMEFKGNPSASYKTDETDGTTTYPDPDNTPVYLYGLYPKAWTVNTTNAYSAEYPFDGKTDVMATEIVSTTKQQVSANPPTYAVLSFKHLLTRLEVKLSGADKALQDLGAINSIQLIGNLAGNADVKNKAVVSYSSQSLVSTFETTVGVKTLDFYGLSLNQDEEKVYTDVVATVGAGALNDEPKLVAYSMVAPLADAGIEKYYLKINDLKTVISDLRYSNGTPFTGSTVGRSFVVSVYFKANEQIIATAVVGDWLGEGEEDLEVAVD